jgi:branched-chain amino acid transport system substrate-binding protein
MGKPHERIYNMKQPNFRRRFAAVSATTLSLGLLVAGASVSSAQATNDGVNTATKTITIGATVPLGGLAQLGFQDVAKSALATFDYVNNHGGINGWKVNFLPLNDCYNLLMCGTNENTTYQTNVLINTPVFATVGSLGTATQQSVEDTLQNNGIPQLFVNSGAHFWNDPSHYPNLFGFQTNYLAEGKIFATYLKANFKGKTVGFLGQDDDFGQDGLQGLKNGGVTPKDQLTYGSTDILPPRLSFATSVAKLQADKIAVVVLDTIPQATKIVLDDAAKLGYKPTWIISGVGSDPQTVNDKNEIGAYSLTFFPATNATTAKANAWNAWANKVLLAESGKTINNVSTDTFTSKSILSGNQLYGVGWAVAFLQTLQAETAKGATPTRSDFVNTMLTTSLSTPAIMPLKYSSTNHQGLTGGYMIKIATTSTDTAVGSSPVVYNVDPVTQALTTSKYVNGTVPSYLH